MSPVSLANSKDDSKSNNFLFLYIFFSFLAAPLIKGQFASAPKFQR